MLSKNDPNDPTSAGPEVRARATEASPSSSLLSGSLNGLTIGIPQVCLDIMFWQVRKYSRALKEYFPHELSIESIDTFRRLVDKLRLSGANVVSVSLPSTRFALSAYYVIASAEASSNLARFSGVHYGEFITLSGGQTEFSCFCRL